MSPEAVYTALLAAHGEQRWWPAQSAFEVMAGAILTQNTAWRNVERAIENLRCAGMLDPAAIAAADPQTLAARLRPSGYFNVKARRLQAFCRWYLAQGGHEALAAEPTGRLRSLLLGVAGIGPETADDILLYAFERPVFVIDAYTRRLFGRLGAVDPRAGYEPLRRHFEARLPRRAALYNELHALIVRHAKEVCRKRPRCGRCCLAARCPAAAPAGGD